MKIAIVGTRNFSRLDLIKTQLSIIYTKFGTDNITIVSGGCRGVDKEAEEIAKTFGFKTEIYNADWDKHGKTAGPIRNSEIVEHSDIFIVFWDGQSRGTRDTINKVIDAGKPLRVYNERCGVEIEQLNIKELKKCSKSS